MLKRDFNISIFGLFGDNIEKSTFFHKPGDSFNPDILFLYVKTIILRGNLKGLSPTVRFLEKCYFTAKTQAKCSRSLPCNVVCAVAGSGLDVDIDNETITTKLRR